MTDYEFVEFVDDFTQLSMSVLRTRPEDLSKRNVCPRLDFKSMEDQELLELFAVLNIALKQSKRHSAIIAGVLTFGIGILMQLWVTAIVSRVLLLVLLFAATYACKVHTYWRLFFSSKCHFYHPIRLVDLAGNFSADLMDMGDNDLIASMKLCYLGWYFHLKTANEFARANHGYRMNEKRARWEMARIRKIVQSRHPEKFQSV